jgi:hypothetical protein
MAEMRAYLRTNSRLAPAENLWDENAVSPFHKKKDGQPKALSTLSPWTVFASCRSC